MNRRSLKTLSAALLATGLALGGAACEVEEGTTSPGQEDPAIIDDGGATDPLGGGDETTAP
jgi:hypothetical protein